MSKLSLFGALALVCTVVGCAAAPDDGGDVLVEGKEDVERSADALTTKTPTPFCLPGEVRRCTLGPPPVCRCEPINPPILQSYVAR